MANAEESTATACIFLLRGASRTAVLPAGVPADSSAARAAASAALSAAKGSVTGNGSVGTCVLSAAVRARGAPSGSACTVTAGSPPSVVNAPWARATSPRVSSKRSDGLSSAEVSASKAPKTSPSILATTSPAGSKPTSTTTGLPSVKRAGVSSISTVRCVPEGSHTLFVCGERSARPLSASCLVMLISSVQRSAPPENTSTDRTDGRN